MAFNDDVDPEVRLRMVVAAINEADDDDVLWCIGDQPVAHLAAVRGFALRLHQARTTSPKVERLFRLMQDYYRNVEKSPDADGGTTGVTAASSECARSPVGA